VGKGLSAKDIHKEMFPVYFGKCLSRKAFDNCVEKRGEVFADDEEVETEVLKWLGPQSKDFCAAGKAMGQAYQCWWRICREIIFFPGSNLACFTFYIHL
jgi:hypothetical protein